ncbi:protein of uncharacterised function (DUF350) [Mycobacteroides abscessus]|nr:hypothetical protein MA4S0303_4892 [Mycobacteroides abscessus 4S-0303]EIT93083.1 hypothetical protein MA4S0726RB_4424 [Mycobacteroides abscessus 4S-0726-RB]EIT96627.1 hypothetical protein MA4S0726RA_4827 [Mycobacteroides abscessus 4S-0726-RA]EIV61060.1 hypothetical protein MA4S0116S_3967 [Mycobacteroides abscessus 4S-0116-S]CPS24685.1 protein of uncharacterised function (DUF350) [Mycobacteroides abscessus]SIA50589.1 protein of uncharacterised function (DUF350) [Mycobacteroides abscessus sub
MSSLARPSSLCLVLRDSVGFSQKQLLVIWLYAAVGFVLMTLGFFVLDWTTPGPLRQMVRAGLPNAAVIAAAGLLSQAFVIVLAIYTASGNIAEGLMRTLVFGLIGIAAQTICIRLIEWVMGIDVGELLAHQRFAPAALVVAAAYLAVGLVIATAIL